MNPDEQAGEGSVAEVRRLTHRPARPVLPIVAPTTTPPGVALTAALEFGTAATTVARVPGSLRRTSHLDSRIIDDPPTAVIVGGAARDLLTSSDGSAQVLAAADLRAALGPDRTLRSLETTPGIDVDALIGRSVGRGFRAAIESALPAERDARSPLFLLLDELPVMLVISGYVSLFSEGGTSNPGVELQRDICSGFRTDGVMMRSFDSTGALPISIGPVGEDLSADDDVAWHEIGGLVPGSMRRRRLVEIAHHGRGAWSFYGYFRDTYRASLDEPEIVMHEYQIHGTLDALDGPTRIVRSCVAEPLTLPWPECPHAAGSAGWIVGRSVDQIRDTVRFDYRGTDTCTHLNDLVRSLGDLDVLADSLTDALSGALTRQDPDR